jgi:hypothetical protein
MKNQIVAIPSKRTLKQLAPRELQVGMEKLKGWIDFFRKRRIIVGVFSVTPGQYCLVVEAASFTKAAEIAESCPAPDYGLNVTMLRAPDFTEGQPISDGKKTE